MARLSNYWNFYTSAQQRRLSIATAAMHSTVNVYGRDLRCGDSVCRDGRLLEITKFVGITATGRIAKIKNAGRIIIRDEQLYKARLSNE